MAEKSAVKLQSLSAVSNGALKADDLPKSIKILDWGKNKTLDGEIVFDEESARVFYANQKEIGRTLAPLDFNHNTVPGTKAYEADKEPRAIAAYGVPTIKPGDGLYYEYLTWTPSGRKSAKDYADLSPAVVTDKNNRVIGLHSCALTPAGSIENLSFYSADTMGSLMDLATTKESDVKTNCAVDYADPQKKLFPLSTEQHVRSAWDFIHMPSSQQGMSTGEIAGIKETIAAKAKQLGIELKAESADNAKVQANAYVQDPYKGIDAMLEEHMEYFRQKLGMDDKAQPDDIMKKLRAKWEGEQPDKEPLPPKTPGSSVDPEKRTEDMSGKSANTVLAYSAEERAKLEAQITEKVSKDFAAKLDEKLSAFSAEFTAMKNERETKAKELEASKRASLVDEASRAGKVIPLSADEIATCPIALLESIVKNAPVEVPLSQRPLRSLTADGKVPNILTGARQRASDAATAFFAQHGIKSGGRPNLTPTKN